VWVREKRRGSRLPLPSELVSAAYVYA